MTQCVPAVSQYVRRGTARSTIVQLTCGVPHGSVFGPILFIVKADRGILMRECANLYKSMKIGTLVMFDMLCPNLPGAKANSQWCRHIRQFKMAAA